MRLGRYSSSALGGNAHSELMRSGHRIHVGCFKVGARMDGGISAWGVRRSKSHPKRQMTQSPEGKEIETNSVHEGCSKKMIIWLETDEEKEMFKMRSTDYLTSVGDLLGLHQRG